MTDTSKDAVERLVNDLWDCGPQAQARKAERMFNALLAEREALAAEVARLTAALVAERVSSEYHLKEIQGCVDEFKDMPCHSLWVRLVQSFERAHAARREGGA